MAAPRKTPKPARSGPPPLLRAPFATPSVRAILERPAIIEETRPLREMARSFRRTSMLAAGLELGLFDALADGPLLAREVARRTKLGLRAAETLLDGLVGLQLLEIADLRYMLTPLAAQYLVRSSPLYYGQVILYPWHCQWPLDGDIVARARADGGRAALPDSGEFRFDLIIEDMVPASVGTALKLCEILSLDGREEPLDVLDVGGGAGVVGGVIARKCPGARVTQVDYARVNHLARQRAAAEGWGDNRYVDGDYMTVKLPRASFDLVILKGVCISESAARMRRLFRRAHGWLRPAGLLVLSEGLLRDDRKAPLGNLRYGSELLLSSPYGRNYTEGEVKAWLEQTGFSLTPVGAFLIGRKLE